MASQLSARLARLEAANASEARIFTVQRTVIIHHDAPSEALPIADVEMDRVRAEGYRAGIDELIIIQRFVSEAP